MGICEGRFTLWDSFILEKPDGCQTTFELSRTACTTSGKEAADRDRHGQDPKIQHVNRSHRLMKFITGFQQNWRSKENKLSSSEQEQENENVVQQMFLKIKKIAEIK